MIRERASVLRYTYIFSLVSSSTRLDRLWDPHIFLFNEHRCSFPGLKRPEREVNLSTPSSGEVKTE
jgi:hypothetical protein